MINSKEQNLNINISPKLHNYLKNFDYYLVGGCVRDAFLGEEYFSDIDIIVGGDTSLNFMYKELQSLEKLDTNIKIQYIENNNPLIRCYIDGVFYDITTSDDDRGLFYEVRDFTMNSVFYQPDKHKIYYLYDSYITDILNKRIVPISPCFETKMCFINDPVRLIRGLRFKNTLNMTYDFTPEQSKSYNHLLNGCSLERIRMEFMKVLDRGNFYQFIIDMKEYGYIKELIPELEEMDAKDEKGEDKYPQPAKYHAEGNPWKHTMLALKYAQEQLLCPTYLTFLGVLFHDIAKPTCFQMRERGGVVKPTFYEHDRIGASIVKPILRRLKYSNFEIDSISYLVSQHMNMFDFFKMRESSRIIIASHHLFNELLMVHKCDIYGSIREDGEQDAAFLQYDKILEWYNEKKEYLHNLPEKLINGNDLLEMGASGPAIGKILDCVWKLQLEGKIKDRDRALKQAKGMIV